MGTTRFERIVLGKRSPTKAAVAGHDAPAEADSPSARIYASNSPRIFLEIVSARSTTLVFAVTYLAFVIGFAIDTSNVYQGFKTDEHHLGMTSTAPAPHEWVGTLTGLRNVVSTRLVVHQSNLTAAIQKFKHLQQPPPVAVGYDVTLWACGLADGCGTAFLRPTAGARGPNNAWQQVLSLTNSVQFPVGALGAGVTLELFPTTYQNEEAIPSVGTVRSYYIAVNYTNNAWGLFTGTDAKLESSAVSYVATVLQQPANPTAVGVGYVILLFLVLAALGGFIYVMVSQKKKWLCEQKWVCWYLTAVILFINPIYCVIIWMQSAPPRPAVVFAFYVVDAMGQAMFVVVWLLFADSINRKRLSATLFYGPKIFVGSAIFALSVAQTALQFPSIGPASMAYSKRSPVLAVYNWSAELQRSYAAVSGCLLVIICAWAVYWLVTLVLTSRKLRALPYMNTRYLQLSFRFFFMQSMLLAAYFVFQYGVVIYYLVKQRGNFASSSDLTDYINTLFREQTQLFGKEVFLAVYALVIAFLYLPAGLVDHTLVTTLASTYVISEKEKKLVEQERGEAIARIRLLSAGVLNNITHVKKEVFCVDTALKYCGLSFEAYYDPPSMRTVSGYDTKPLELEKYGYTLIESIYRPDHETFCFVARHVTLNRIVVCFRGTSCKQHWSDNLNYAKRLLDLPELAAVGTEEGEEADAGGMPPPTSTACTVATSSLLTPAPFATADTDGSPADAAASMTTPRSSHVYRSLSPAQHAARGPGRVTFQLPVTPPSDLRQRIRRCSSSMKLGGDRQTDQGGVDDGEEDSDSDVDDESGGGIEVEVRDAARGAAARVAGQSEGQSRRRSDVSDGGGRQKSVNAELTMGLERGMNQLADAATDLVGGATDLVVGVAAVTPGLQAIVNPHVHSGFWEAYAVVREDLHRILCRELKRSPAHLYFVGHSLGGALATIAALDASVNIVPRVNADLARQTPAAQGAAPAEGGSPSRHRSSWNVFGDGESAATSPLRQLFQRPQAIFRGYSPRVDSPRAAPPPSDPIPVPLAESSTMRHVDHNSRSIFSSSLTVRSGSSTGATQRPSQSALDALSTIDEGDPREEGEEGMPGGCNAEAPTRPVRKVKVSMYSFGSPRVGNSSFAQLYDRMVPDSFRTVVDGDVVTSLPPTGYRHVGTEALVDNLGAGSIIMDPSFIERRLRTHTKASVSVHSLLIYKRGLQGVKDAAEHMKKAARNSSTRKAMDVVRLALASSNTSAVARRSEPPTTPSAAARASDQDHAAVDHGDIELGGMDKPRTTRSTPEDSTRSTPVDRDEDFVMASHFAKDQVFLNDLRVLEENGASFSTAGAILARMHINVGGPSSPLPPPSLFVVAQDDRALTTSDFLTADEQEG